MDSWWHGIVEDFSDIPDLAEGLRLGLRLIIAILLGGLLGFNRERAGKAAGLRTHMLVALGAALFIVIAQQSGASSGEVSRVVQGVVVGVGFLGAGSILKQGTDIQGLTTAAGIWLTAAVGVAAGLGREVTAIMGAMLAFLTLSALQKLESRISKQVDDPIRRID